MDAEFVGALFLVLWLFLKMEEEEEEERRRTAYTTWQLALLSSGGFVENDRPRRYCSLNPSVPILQLFFDLARDTRTDFRLQRESLQALLHLLDGERRHGWGHTLEVLTFLFWLASGTSYRVVAQAFAMPRSAVHYVIHRVADQVTAILPRVVRLPSTAMELEEVGRGFARLGQHAAFQAAVGAIDGCDVRIKAPAEPDAQCYRNRKLFTSIQLQGVCDANGIFLDIFVGYPGSVHDARVLWHSSLYRAAQYPPPGYFLLGDGGYPCLENPIALITPFKNPVRGDNRLSFNRAHSRARSIIEVHPTFVPKVIGACACLHNICLGVGDVFPEEEGVEREEPEERVMEIPGAVSGNALRDQLCAAIAED